MQDLLFFVLLWAIFLVSYGVMMEALRLPGSYSSWDRLERVIYVPYWQMYNMIDGLVQTGVLAVQSCLSPFVYCIITVIITIRFF